MATSPFAPAFPGQPGRAARVVTAALAFAWGGARAAEVPAPPELPAVLRLADALRLFRQTGLDLLIAEATVAGAEADVRSAGALPNPAVSGNLGRSWNCGPAGCAGPAWGAGISDQAALSDALTGKRGLRREVAEAALGAARKSREDAERTLALQVKTQFLSLVVAQRALEYAREAASATREMLALMQVRLAAGAVSEADVARTEVLALEAERGVDAGQQSVGQARAGLAFLLGARGLVAEFQAVEPALLGGAVPAALAEATPESLLGLAREHRPDLAAAALQERRAAAAESLARRQLVPDLTLSLSYAQQGSGPSAVTPPTGTIGISFPLPVLYQQQGEIAKARADRRLQAASRARLEAQVGSDVQVAWAAFVASRRMVQRMETRHLDRARVARDLVRVQYQKGAASLLDFLDAERTYVATQVEYLDDLSSCWTAVFQIEAAVGTELGS